MNQRAKELAEIRSKIESLYESGAYYASISPEEFTTNGSEEYWGVIVDPDGNVRNRLEEKNLYIDDVKYIIDYINAIESLGILLDIGCGLGWLLSQINPEWEKYGIEPEVKAAAISSEFAKIQNCDIEDAQYDDNFFDLIIMHHTIEHMAYPEEVILKVHKMLKKDGILIIATPDFDSACARRYKQNYRMLFDPTHISLFTNDSMHRFLRDNGFHIRKVEYPYFETRFFTEENLFKLLKKDVVSPPFYGNFMTFFCSKNDEQENAV